MLVPSQRPMNGRKRQETRCRKRHWNHDEDRDYEVENEEARHDEEPNPLSMWYEILHFRFLTIKDAIQRDRPTSCGEYAEHRDHKQRCYCARGSPVPIEVHIPLDRDRDHQNATTSQ